MLNLSVTLQIERTIIVPLYFVLKIETRRCVNPIAGAKCNHAKIGRWRLLANCLDNHCSSSGVNIGFDENQGLPRAQNDAPINHGQRPVRTQKH